MSVNDHPSVKAAQELDGPIGEVSVTEQAIRDRIIHVLSIYPKLSNSMLQVGVGTSLPPIIWKPILNQMIAEGTIIQSSISAMTPGDRQQSYIILSLVTND